MHYTKDMIREDLQYFIDYRACFEPALQTFGTIDPDARPVADAYQKAWRELVLEIEKRGFTAQPLPRCPVLTSERASLLAFTKALSYKRDQELSAKYGDCVPARQQYLEQHDRALVPFFQALTAARDNLGRYCDSRLEALSGA